MKQQIHYLSTYPGVGKTHYTIDKLARNINTKKIISIYVAPTVKLLEQVRNDVFTKIDKELHDKIVIIQKQSFSTVEDSVVSFLEGRAKLNGTKFLTSCAGSVIMLTHSGFLTLGELPKQEQIHVFFDEARKCVTDKRRLTLDTLRQSSAIAELCKDIEHQGAQENFKKITCEPDAYKKLIAANKKQDLGFEKVVLDKLRPYLEAAANPKLDVYFKYDDKTKKPSLNFFEIVVPSRIFDGFRRVTLLSAFFEDSQMYHLLKYSKKVNLINITNSVENIQDRTDEILKRYESVELVSLTKQTKALSIANLSSGIMLNKAMPKEASKFLDLGIVNKRSISVLREHIENKGMFVLKEPYLSAVKLIEESPELCQINPVAWHIKTSLRIIKKWSTLRTIRGKPLLFINNIFQKELLDDKNSLKINKNWELLTTSVHGLNTFSDRNAVAFLAAINPSPSLINFYYNIMPGYNFEADHVADVCIQCVCRTSVRDTSSTEKVLVIVPDLAIKAHLFQKMAGLPKVISKIHSDDTMVFVETSKRKTLGKAPKSDSAKSKKWKETNPLNVELLYIQRKVKFYLEKLEDTSTSAVKRAAFKKKLEDKKLRVKEIEKQIKKD